MVRAVISRRTACHTSARALQLPGNRLRRLYIQLHSCRRTRVAHALLAVPRPSRARCPGAGIQRVFAPGPVAFESRTQVRFEELLPEMKGKAPLTRTNAAHLPSAADAPPPARIEARNTGAFNGINDVEVEQEMVELSQNAVHYQAIAQLVAGRYRALLEAIRTEG